MSETKPRPAMKRLMFELWDMSDPSEPRRIHTHSEGNDDLDALAVALIQKFMRVVEDATEPKDTR